MKAAQEALQAGKIKHIGISSHSMDVAEKAISSGHFETIMFPFNFISDEPADRFVPLAQKYDVGFIAMKPLAGGMVNDANLAFKYLLQFDTVVPIPGIEKITEIEEIVDIMNGFWTLTLQDQQKMEDIRAQLGTRFCRQCEYCHSCPQGVRIPMLLIMQIMWKLWPVDIFTEWMGRIVKGGRNCKQCGECEEKCPYQLPIREMIAENIEFYENMAPKKIQIEKKSY
jgi:predicted aldo/keto reductase-like oxidoreductase